MSPYTDVRDRVHAALADVGVPAHRAAPATVSGPCVAVLWPEGQWIGSMGSVDLAVAVMVPTAGGNEPATVALEDLMHTTREALWAAGIPPGVVYRPEYSTDLGALIALIPVNLRATCN